MNNNTTSNVVTATCPFNVSRWALEAEHYDWYNQVNAWTNPEVAGLVPLLVDIHRSGHYVLHLAGLA